MFLLQPASSEGNIESIPDRLHLMARHGSRDHHNELLPTRTAVDVASLLSTWQIAPAYSAAYRLDEGSQSIERFNDASPVAYSVRNQRL